MRLSSLEILTVLFVISATGCTGRARRPVVVGTPTSISTSPKTTPTGGGEETPADGRPTGGEEGGDDTAKGPGDQPKDGPNGAPDGGGAPTDGGAPNGGGAPADGAPPALFRYTTPLPDGTTKVFEWDGKGLMGNEPFDIVFGQ